LTDIVPLRWRPKWYGIILAAWALGLAVGPVFGGAIVQNTTWRWIFYLMFPLCGFGLVAIPYLLTLKPQKASAQEKLSRIDWIGGFLFTASATLFLIAISWGGTTYAWDSAATLAPLIIGVVGFAITMTYENHFAQHPFLRKSLFKNISSIVTYLAAGAQGLMLYGALYYCPFYFMSVKEFTALNTGAALLPLSLVCTLAGIVVGRLVARFNNYRWLVCAGWFVGAVCPAMMMTWRLNDSVAVWVVAYVLGGIGHGAILTAQTFAAQALCNPGDEGRAAAMYTFARQFGMAIGVGIGATIFQNVMKLKLRWEGLPTEIAEQAEAYIPTLHSLPDGPQRDVLYDAYKFGFQIVFAVFVALSVIMLFLCLMFLQQVNMDRKLDTEHKLDSKRMVRHWGHKEPSASESEK
jgi:MFS family permease